MVVIILGAILVAGSAVAAGAPSVASAWQTNPYGRTRLIAAADGAGPGDKTLQFGWQIELAAGWKTYWRSPGEAGLPPRFDWKKSRNVAAVKVDWPMPERYSLYGYDTAIYQGEVVLPLTVVLREPGKPATVDLAIDYMVCNDVCVPLIARYALTLPVKMTPRPSRESHAIETYAAAVPKTGQVRVRKIAFHGSDSALIVDVALGDSARRITDVFVVGPDSLAFGRASGGGPLRIPVMGRSPAGVAGHEITLVFADDRGVGYAWTGTVAVAACNDPSLKQC